MSNTRDRQAGDKKIMAMEFDTTAEWLLVACKDGSLHVLPFLSLLCPSAFATFTRTPFSSTDLTSTCMMTQPIRETRNNTHSRQQDPVWKHLRARPLLVNNRRADCYRRPIGRYIYINNTIQYIHKQYSTYYIQYNTHTYT